MPRNIAIFDFDHTLITGDSFLPYLTYVAGKGAAYAALAEGAILLAIEWARKRDIDKRYFLKAHVLKRLLAGRRAVDLIDAARKMRGWQKENPATMRALRDHAQKGDMIVIASGGLDLYLPEMLRGTPYDALICTAVGVDGGIVTGEMIHGNCVRARKAELVGAFMAQHGPFDESFGYGNYPHDVPMLELVKHRVII